ncbi:MAG: hypothetical protein GY739_21900, partial [Mesoflavibacter sp.]|nr:hypothetical protein [Mesoflavibacter sp.]
SPLTFPGGGTPTSAEPDDGSGVAPPPSSLPLNPSDTPLLSTSSLFDPLTTDKATEEQEDAANASLSSDIFLLFRLLSPSSSDIFFFFSFITKKVTTKQIFYSK